MYTETDTYGLGAVHWVMESKQTCSTTDRQGLNIHCIQQSTLQGVAVVVLGEGEAVFFPHYPAKGIDGGAPTHWTHHDTAEFQ